MKTALKALLLATTALVATPVFAQQQPTPPEYYTVDAQGVDLVQGIAPVPWPACGCRAPPATTCR